MNPIIVLALSKAAGEVAKSFIRENALLHWTLIRESERTLDTEKERYAEKHGEDYDRENRPEKEESATEAAKKFAEELKNFTGGRFGDLR